MSLCSPRRSQPSGLRLVGHDATFRHNAEPGGTSRPVCPVAGAFRLRSGQATELGGGQ